MRGEVLFSDTHTMSGRNDNVCVDVVAVSVNAA
jgi:hypothetical protein